MTRIVELTGVVHHAGTCRWAVPTLFLPAPFWFDANACPWTCVRDSLPRLLSTTEGCDTCTHWRPRPIKTADTIVDPDPRNTLAAAALMIDWFHGLQPHEIN